MNIILKKVFLLIGFLWCQITLYAQCDYSSTTDIDSLVGWRYELTERDDGKIELLIELNLSSRWKKELVFRAEFQLNTRGFRDDENQEINPERHETVFFNFFPPVENVFSKRILLSPIENALIYAIEGGVFATISNISEDNCACEVMTTQKISFKKSVIKHKTIEVGKDLSFLEKICLKPKIRCSKK